MVIICSWTKRSFLFLGKNALVYLKINQSVKALWHQRWIQGEGWGGCNRPFGKFSNLSGYPCLSLFQTKNSIISYNISSSSIDNYKKPVAIPLLDFLIIQMQDRFSDKDRHSRNLLCLVPWIINKAQHLDDEVEGMLLWRKTFHFWNPLETRYVDGKHSGSQQIGSFQITFY